MIFVDINYVDLCADSFIFFYDFCLLVFVDFLTFNKKKKKIKVKTSKFIYGVSTFETKKSLTSFIVFKRDLIVYIIDFKGLKWQMMT